MSENIWSSSGGVQEKGKRGNHKRMKTSSS
jgi:hypothetical protein